MRDNTNKGCLIMLSHLHISQLDILGFTEVYRLLFILAISLIIIAFIMFPLVRLFIKWYYISFMVFIFMTCLLWIIILLYDIYFYCLFFYLLKVITFHLWFLYLRHVYYGLSF